MCLTLQDQKALFRFAYFYSTDNLTRLGRDKLIHRLICNTTALLRLRRVSVLVSVFSVRQKQWIYHHTIFI